MQGQLGQTAFLFVCLFDAHSCAHARVRIFFSVRLHLAKPPEVSYSMDPIEVLTAAVRKAHLAL